MSYTNDYQSIYCYDGTDVLINKFDITDQSLLDKIEADITRKNIALLNMRPITGKFDLKHLQNIHKAIFKDIYPFAGQIRSESISKGNTMFAMPQYINQCSEDLFKKLKKDNLLKEKLDVNEFSQKIAYYMSEINIIHPFREGNGRATREFIRTLGIKCGYSIQWSRITKNELITASIRSVTNPDLMEQLIRKSIGS